MVCSRAPTALPQTCACHHTGPSSAAQACTLGPEPTALSPACCQPRLNLLRCFKHAPPHRAILSRKGTPVGAAWRLMPWVHLFICKRGHGNCQQLLPPSSAHPLLPQSSAAVHLVDVQSHQRLFCHPFSPSSSNRNPHHHVLPCHHLMMSFPVITFDDVPQAAAATTRPGVSLWATAVHGKQATSLLCPTLKHMTAIAWWYR